MESTRGKEPCLVYIQIGDTVPEHLFESLHQTLVLHGGDTKVYVVVNQSMVRMCNEAIARLNVDTFTRDGPIRPNAMVHVVPKELLDPVLATNEPYQRYSEHLRTKYNTHHAFRDGFWVSTTSRFF